MNPIKRAPSNCTAAQLEAFKKLAIEGGEVATDGLANLIGNAERLLFLEDSEIRGIGGVKNPRDTYRKKVFDAAGVLDALSDYPIELGWFYVPRSLGGKGLGRKLLKSAIEFMGERHCYATTSSDNKRMKHLLSTSGFTVLGSSYKNAKGDGTIDLYTRKP